MPNDETIRSQSVVEDIMLALIRNLYYFWCTKLLEFFIWTIIWCLILRCRCKTLEQEQLLVIVKLLEVQKTKLVFPPVFMSKQKDSYIDVLSVVFFVSEWGF